MVGWLAGLTSMMFGWVAARRSARYVSMSKAGAGAGATAADDEEDEDDLVLLARSALASAALRAAAVSLFAWERSLVAVSS